MNNKTDYWLQLCDEDLISAKALLNAKQLLHMGFFCHMIAEKALKAVISNTIADTPPKIHNLIRLAELGCILNELSDSQLRLLDILKPLQIEARYPAYKTAIKETLTYERCTQILIETREFLCWIKKKLGR